MENKSAMNHQIIDEITKRELENIEVPYNAYDWEKIEELLANFKTTKTNVGSKFSIPTLKVENTINNVSTLKKFNFSNIIFGIVIIIGVIVLLFRIFDNSPSEEDNIPQVNSEAGSNEDIVRGMDTLKKIPHKVVKEEDIKPATAVIETPASPINGSTPPTTVIKAGPEPPKVANTATTTAPATRPIKREVIPKKTEPTVSPENPKSKVKMEVEEIEEIEIPARPASLVKRKKETTPTPTATPTVQPVKQPLQETEANFEESRSELKKRKREKADLEKEQRPKAFRELDSIR
jgi:cytoskeletal protein RodZ